jgi:hypothetical protein
MDFPVSSRSTLPRSWSRRYENSVPGNWVEIAHQEDHVIVTRHRIPAQRPAEARQIVRTRLDGVAPEVVETVELLTSELVNNAILYGSGVAALVLELEDDHVRVEVHDTDPTLELAPIRHAPSSVRGRGLAIVDALATAWGVNPRPVGKSVWFELTI